MNFKKQKRQLYKNEKDVLSRNSLSNLLLIFCTMVMRHYPENFQYVTQSSYAFSSCIVREGNYYGNAFRFLWLCWNWELDVIWKWKWPLTNYGKLFSLCSLSLPRIHKFHCKKITLQNCFYAYSINFYAADLSVRKNFPSAFNWRANFYVSSFLLKKVGKYLVNDIKGQSDISLNTNLT